MRISKSFNLFSILTGKIPALSTYLPVSPNNRGEQFERATTTVHPNHAENLEETQTAQGAGCKHVPIAIDGQNNHASHNHYDIFSESFVLQEMRSTRQTG